eukprot:CAMPEP_0114990180 /NCGR_PEP_ID=MMETSP0216-20121206/10639_1 /TAXON_ID=223996 /ORGANISM="Protocruzia adherens, Strain Boccale" /LENGTH=222 /DNA_ID=CAMNT_0002353299 /DNA_START=1213 /DNA_END=1881 /DNA_ORIENTATION=-
MCQLLAVVESFLTQEPVKARRMGSAYKWQPIKSLVCDRDDCHELVRVMKGVLALLKAEIHPSLDHAKEAPAVEETFVEESLKFSELARLRDSSILSFEEKIKLISLPDSEQLCTFLSTLLTQADVCEEIFISSMILLKRFLEVTGWKLRATNWRVLCMISIRVALKCEDAKLISFHKLSILYPIFDEKELAELERLFLSLIDYRCFISYEDYYCMLKQLYHE